MDPGTLVAHTAISQSFERNVTNTQSRKLLNFGQPVLNNCRDINIYARKASYFIK